MADRVVQYPNGQTATFPGDLPEADFQAASAAKWQGMQQQQPDSVVGGFLRRAWDTVKGSAQTVLTPPDMSDSVEKYMGNPADVPPALDLLPGGGGMGVIASRILRGLVYGEEAAGSQAKQEYQQGQPVKAGITAASMLDPFATGSVANVNRLQDEGRSKEATGQGLFDALTLGIGLGLGRLHGVAPEASADSPAAVTTTNLFQDAKPDPAVLAEEAAKVKHLANYTSHAYSAGEIAQGLKESALPTAGNEINSSSGFIRNLIDDKLGLVRPGDIAEPLPDKPAASAPEAARQAYDLSDAARQTYHNYVTGRPITPADMRLLLDEIQKIPLQRRSANMAPSGRPTLLSDPGFETFVEKTPELDPEITDVELVHPKRTFMTAEERAAEKAGVVEEPDTPAQQKMMDFLLSSKSDKALKVKTIDPTKRAEIAPMDTPEQTLAVKQLTGQQTPGDYIYSVGSKEPTGFAKLMEEREAAAMKANDAQGLHHYGLSVEPELKGLSQPEAVQQLRLWEANGGRGTVGEVVRLEHEYGRLQTFAKAIYGQPGSKVQIGRTLVQRSKIAQQLTQKLKDVPQNVRSVILQTDAGIHSIRFDK